MGIMVLSVLTVFGSPDVTGEKLEEVIGAWVHKDFYYVFQDSVMTAIKIDGEPKGYKTFNYSVKRLGFYNLIRYGRNLSDSTSFDFLLFDEVTDSTAVFALGTTFVRADSTTGLIGTWKHMKNFKTINLTIGSSTIDYQETIMDYKTGLTSITEERHGIYKPWKGRYTGRFFVRFDDGTRTTIVPVLFGNIMYLCDLSPRKSIFIRTAKAPSYRDYQDAISK